MSRNAATWVCALALIAACAESETVPRTQVTLVVRAEPAVEQDAARVTIAFRTGTSRDELADSDAGERFGNGSDPDSLEWPISLSLIRSSDASVFEVQIEALDAGGELIARKVIQSGFAENKTKLLEVLLQRLDSACRDADCSASQNCSQVSGEAVCEDPPFLDPDDLPDFKPDAGTEPPPPGGDPCDAADAPDCGDHGRCTADGQDATCECDPEYAGATCTACAAGYVLVEDVCVEICGAEDMAACASGEICMIDSAGDPSCVAVCSSGMLPNAAGDCVPICDSVIAPDCGDRGACTAATMPPTCVCDAGYTGDGCDACDVGYGDDGSGGCVELCSSVEAPSCGANGSCVVDGDSAVCECTFPYTGSVCDQCARGYTQNGDVCEPDCGVCGDHQFCDAAPTVPECACVLGYTEPGAVDPPVCAWEGGGANGGGVLDEAFGDETAWDTRLATFDQDFFGDGDGLVEFERLGLCGDATIAQTFDMPNTADAEPLVFAIEYFSNAMNFECDSEAALIVGGVPQPLPMNYNQNGTARVCLGENAFGPGVQLEVRARSELGCPSQINCAPRSFGGIAIEPAMPGECGMPGHFGNADFGTNGLQGWTFNGFQGQSVGAGGTMVLQSRTGCSQPYAENSVSVPTASELPNPAIQFAARYDLGARGGLVMNPGYVELGFDGEYTAVRRAPLVAGAGTTITTCLPDFMAGTARKLRIGGFYATNTCYPDNDVPPTSLYDLSISGLMLVSDPDCAPGVPDLMLDIPAEKTPWTVIVGYTQNPNSTAQIFEAAGVAHSGDRAIRLQTGTASACVQNSASTRVLVPELESDRRPVMRFWHRIDTPGGPQYSTSPFGGVFMPAVDWQQREVCIDETFGGELVNLRFDMGCNNDGVQHSLFIDDVELDHCANPGPCTAGACP